jgi:aspartyl-tRNA(Asn)/glutamyl-tRNA(Gln) amidotransferase subunit A
MNYPNQISIDGALTRIHNGSTSSRQLTEAALKNMESAKHLNIFRTTNAEDALNTATQSDDRRRSGLPVRALEGIPISIKDLFNMRALPARGGSNAPMPDLGVEEGTVVRRLREAGAVFLGTTNMHEVGLGLSGENPSTGDVRNPIDPRRQAGGSSSGAGAAIGANIGFASIGTDTGGSIRVPASHCGAVSFKPSFGLVPLDGVIPLASTCDHAGPITRSVADARRIVEVMAGTAFDVDRLDQNTSPKIGIPWNFLEGRLSHDVRRTFSDTMNRLARKGTKIIEATPALIELSTPTYTTICWAEGAFVHRATAMSDELRKFTPGVQRSLEHGLRVLAVNYLEAVQIRRNMVRAFAELFAKTGIDVLILPAVPTPAPLLGSTAVEIESGECPHRDAFIPISSPFSLCGLPVVSLPFANIGNLPVSLQIVGAAGADARVLEVAHWLEASPERHWKFPV